MTYPFYKTNQKSEFRHRFFNIRMSCRKTKKIDFRFRFWSKKRMERKVDISSL